LKENDEKLGKEEMAKELVLKSINLGTKDNVSALILKF
jgi:hypothetical protein